MRKCDRCDQPAILWKASFRLPRWDPVGLEAGKWRWTKAKLFRCEACMNRGAHGRFHKSKNQPEYLQ